MIGGVAAGRRSAVPARSRLRRGGLLALGLGLTAALLLGEALGRALSGPGSKLYETSPIPGLIYSSIPGAGGPQRMGPDRGLYEVHVDARGARRDAAGDPACGEVWVLGDSFPFGWGVGDAETWPAQLRAPLGELLGCPPRVSNWGLPGYHLGQVEAKLRSLLASQRADLVLVHVEQLDGFPDFNFANPLGVPEWLARSGLLRPAQELAVLRFDRSIVESDVETAKQDLRLIERIRSLGRLAAERGLRLLLAAEPEVPEPALRAITESLGAPVGLRACNGEGMRLHGDPHYSADGNRCVAERVAEALVARGLLQRRASPGSGPAAGSRGSWTWR